MSSPPPESGSTDSRAERLAAIERREAAQAASSASVIASAPSPTRHTYTNFDKDHVKRQELRRLIDPGILRPNSREVAQNALKTLLQLGENILNNLEDPKYQRFKPTNTKVKATLIDPAGALEYAIALGFKPEVEKFQPYYIWHKKYLPDLRIGVAVLQEVIERETIKLERLDRARAEEKAAAEAQIEKVKQAFMDDRKSREITDEIERQRRAAVAARGLAPPPTSESDQPPPYIPGAGIVLNGSNEQPESIDQDTEDD